MHSISCRVHNNTETALTSCHSVNYSYSQEDLQKQIKETPAKLINSTAQLSAVTAFVQQTANVTGNNFYPSDTSERINCHRLSVQMSIISRCSTETAKRRTTQTTPHDSPGLCFCCRKSWQNSNGVTPTEVPNAGGVGKMQVR